MYICILSNCYGLQKNNPLDNPVLKVITWNIQDLGGTKNEAEIAVIAKILKEFDLVGIQEIVAKDPAGAKAVARIVDALNRLGSGWDYSISKPTKSSSSFMSERYAFLWKTAKISLKKKPFLDKELEDSIEREPFIGLFDNKQNNTSFYVVNMHAKTFNKHPEMEISNFKAYPKRFQTDRFIILGDFNLDEKHTVWNPLYKMGFTSAISNQPTTLKRTCLDGNYLNYPIDNIYYNTKYFTQQKAYAIDFVKECDNLVMARRISDHLPVASELVFHH
ncbi:endonuclease/exonuclease/phosphatase family protein [Polaribacter sp.]|uniref:endonuclease/exonuclease/phosphatase family protein n=1 Tax=Polaribacter sp. TaxID=1920175 RepID=UPI004048A45E